MIMVFGIIIFALVFAIYIVGAIIESCEQDYSSKENTGNGKEGV